MLVWHRRLHLHNIGGSAANLRLRRCVCERETEGVIHIFYREEKAINFLYIWDYENLDIPSSPWYITYVRSYVPYVSKFDATFTLRHSFPIHQWNLAYFFKFPKNSSNIFARNQATSCCVSAPRSTSLSTRPTATSTWCTTTTGQPGRCQRCQRYTRTQGSRSGILKRKKAWKLCGKQCVGFDFSGRLWTLTSAPLWARTPRRRSGSRYTRSSGTYTGPRSTGGKFFFKLLNTFISLKINLVFQVRRGFEELPSQAVLLRNGQVRRPKEKNRCVNANAGPNSPNTRTDLDWECSRGFDEQKGRFFFRFRPSIYFNRAAIGGERK